MFKDAKEVKRLAAQARRVIDERERAEYPENLANEINSVKRKIADEIKYGVFWVRVYISSDYRADVIANLRRDGFKVSKWSVWFGGMTRIEW